MINTENNINQKRTLTKVRKPFLNPSSNDQKSEPPITSNISLRNTRIYILSVCLGLVELNGKIFVGTQFLNICHNIVKTTVENHLTFKVVAFTLEQKLEFSSILIEENITRLELSESPHLVKWGQRIREYVAKFPKVMADYFDLLSSKDLEISKGLRRAKMRAEVACKEIENKYMYRKFTIFASRELLRIVSSAYSEGLIKELGYTLESFLENSKHNGLPTLCDKDFPPHINVAKKFIDCVALSGSFYQEEPEFTTFLYNIKGSKTEIVAQYINILEPTPTGIFNFGYFVIKRVVAPENNDELLRDGLIEKNVGITTIQPLALKDETITQMISRERNSDTPELQSD